MKLILTSLVSLAAMSVATPAFAGQWRVNPNKCPDLIEDRIDRRESRRDERHDYSRLDVVEDRLDRREDRRDRSVTVCPQSAFYYVPSRGEARRAAKIDYLYDRHRRAHYRWVDGVRIYVDLH
ncbi:MAG: hypothetical protein AAFR21_05470 [Pseudomonadota bacterium]